MPESVKPNPDDALVVRTTPTQARAQDRVNVLLDAAATIINEHGCELLTTHDVAVVVGCSIGTVYRYFPDRLAILQHLALRNRSSFKEDCIDTIDAHTHHTPRDAVRYAFQSYATAFRSQPGFRSLRFGDLIDARPLLTAQGGIALTAADLAVRIQLSYPQSESAVLKSGLGELLDVQLTIFDALLARAFARDDNGDPKLVGAAHNAMSDYSFI